MNSAGKVFLIILFMLNPFISAQEIARQYNYALSLFEKEDYFNSVTEFKRLMFFDKKNVYAYESNFYTGKAYKAGARFNDAIQYFARAAASARTNEEAFLSKIESVKSNILRRTFIQAHNLLNDLEREDYGEKTNELFYWRGWVYMFSDQWDKAAEVFGWIDQDHELKHLSLETDEKKYSVTKAKVLSYIIPGAGQFYTGNYLSGILSLGWNVLWGYITINAFIEDRIFDGFAVGNLLWLRFYNGNVHNAEQFARMENNRINNESLKFLEKIYTGPKP
jgi:hypothetical protein